MRNSELIEKIYAQHLNFSHPKFSLLPIGIANSMYTHGDVDTLFRIMTETYHKIKPNPIYINLTTDTFPYRNKVVKCVEKYRWAPVKYPAPHDTFLKDMSSHRFALCVRGNGIDTHRFWEALYLGVIPVVIDNHHTECHEWIQCIVGMKLPIYVIKHFSEFCENNHDTVFSQKLYDEIMEKCRGYKKWLGVSAYF